MNKRILIMAGGTGGHVIPALAVATHLKKHHQFEVAWLGTKQGLEAKLVPANGITLHYLNINGLRGKGVLGWLKLPWTLGCSIIQSIRVIRKYKPHVILGMGGYASGPGGIACFLLRKPLVIHEQNSIAGMTNRYLAKVANKVLQAFPGTFKNSYHPFLTGNPVRVTISELKAPQQRWAERQQPLKLLVLGGSLGAHALNEVIVKTLPLFDKAERPEVWHQCGEKHLSATQQLYKELAQHAKVEAFIDDMAKAYAWADLVLCRAGALTIAELSAAGVGSILIPFPYAVDDHQTTNANYLVQSGAAILVTQATLTPDRLQQLLKPFIDEPQKCLIMAQAARRQYIDHATRRVAEHCIEACYE